MKSRLKKTLSVFFVILVTVFILFILFRNPILHWGINKATTIIRQHTGATLKVESAGFSGLFSVSMHSISLVPLQGDTLFKADSVSIRASVWTLFLGIIRIKEVHASSVKLTISCNKNICNFSGFIHEKRAAAASGERNYSLMLKRIFEKAFNFAPQRADLHNISLEFRNDTLERSLIINEFHSDENSMSGIAEDAQTHSAWKCEGRFSQIHQSFHFSIYPVESGKTYVPIIKELFGISMGFDTIHIGLDDYKASKNLLTTNGTFSIKQLKFFHQKISNDTVRVPSASFNFKFHAGKTYLELDSNSVATLGDISFNPFVRYSNEKNKEYSINIQTEKVEADRFFSSLPKGMFDEVRDIQAIGSLQFIMNFNIDTSRPDSLIFQTTFRKEKFRIKNYGTSDLMKMNGEFLHSVYEKSRLTRTFMVGPSNSAFTPLDSISPYFINAVLTSEDGNFFFHNGFNEDAFRKSIIANFKAGKFVRGGSTISMQLVKNVFLSRKKTVARKAEEVLLVWLIESNRLYSKQRMLEVYMNIIELGPDIYGISEASAFYFKKRPLAINLPEGIFLASLLPRPKWFKYSFDTLGNLKPHLADYYRIVSDYMLRKNLITQEEHDQLKPFVEINGPAKEMIIPKDTLPIDLEEEINLKLKIDQ